MWSQCSKTLIREGATLCPTSINNSTNQTKFASHVDYVAYISIANYENGGGVLLTIENKLTRMRAHFTIGEKLCPLFTDFSADARSEQNK